MKTFLTLFILAASANVFSETAPVVPTNNSCSIDLFAKVYRLEKNQILSSTDIIQKSNCDVSIVVKLAQIISSSNGTIGASFLRNELKKDFSTSTIEISPRKISLLDLNSTLRDQLTSNSNLYFLESKSLNGIKSIGLSEDEQLKATCESCSSFGEKNIKVELSSPFKPSSKTFWFSSKIMALVKVFKAKRSLSYQQKKLETDDFYSDEIYTSNPDNVLTSLANIKFYKPNRNIIQDAVVSNLDLQPVNLISFGTPVSVSLKNQNINLQRTAMPTRSALFGEVIELKNPNNNKIIAGKVVDYNKVVIEL